MLFEEGYISLCKFILSQINSNILHNSMSKGKTNLLETIPVRCDSIKTEWEGENVILSFPRFKSTFITRYFLPKGVYSPIRVRLEEHGTAVWQFIDGERSVQDIIDLLKDHFAFDEEYASRVMTYIMQLHKDKFILLCQP